MAFRYTREQANEDKNITELVGNSQIDISLSEFHLECVFNKKQNKN